MNRIALHEYLSKEDVIHSTRVGYRAYILSKRMGLSDVECERMKYLGEYHDIGKSLICDSLLTKEGKLTVDEFEIIKKHALHSANILVDHGFELEFARIVLHHHENYDSTGYPLGLMGDEIPVESQIISICDYVDTRTYPRVYRKSILTKFEMINDLYDLKWKKFHGEIADQMILILTKELHEQYQINYFNQTVS